VRASVGDGVILAALEGDSSAGPRYRVEFPFGIGYLRSHAILHEIENSESAKMMEKEQVPIDNEAAVRLDKKFKLLFGSECIYLFLRLFTSLVTLLDQIETDIRDQATDGDPTTGYYDPMNSMDEKEVPKLDFTTVVTKLKSVFAGSLSLKDFEAYCRRVSPESVFKMAALPKLVERGATTLKKMAEEDLILQLFDHCQFTGAVSYGARMIIIRSFIPLNMCYLLFFLCRILLSSGTNVSQFLPRPRSAFNTILTTDDSTFLTYLKVRLWLLLLAMMITPTTMMKMTRPWKTATSNRRMMMI
jgi:hypothetical protein